MKDKDIEFVDGMYIDPPPEKAPDFVKAKISIKIDNLIKFLQDKKTKGDDWVNLDIKVAKSTGNWYVSVNDWKPDPNYKKPGGPPADPPPGKTNLDDFDDDVPF